MVFSASAEQVDPEGWRPAEVDAKFDAAAFFREILSGEDLASLISIDKIPDMIKRQALRGLSELTLNLALPVLACVLLRVMTGSGGGTGFMLNLLCAVCCGKALAQIWMNARDEIHALIDGLLRTTDSMTPMIASVAALTGGGFWSSAVVPLSNLCVAFIQRIVRDWGLRLCGMAVVIALCGAIAGKYALNRLLVLVKTVSRWLLGVAVFLYGGLISAQGLIGVAGDGATVRTTKIAMESLIPIIGGGLSDAAGSLVLSAGLVRSAIGVTGVALIARLCLNPMLRLGGRMLALKLLSAAMEPFAEGAVSTLIGHFGDILETMLAMAVCCGAMAAMLPAAFAALSGGIIR